VLDPADCVRLPQLLADPELELVLRAPELFHAPGDHIEEESVIDDAMYVCARCARVIGTVLRGGAISRCELGRAAVLLLGVGFPCGGGLSPAGPLGCSEFAAQGRHRSGAGERSEQPAWCFHNFAVKSRILQPSRDLLEAIRVLAPRHSDIFLGTQPAPHSPRRCRN
jgi:hypothetical protein